MSNVYPCWWLKPLHNHLSGVYVWVFTEIYQISKDEDWLAEEQLAFLEELCSKELVSFVHKQLTLKSVQTENINCKLLKWRKKSLKHRWKTCLKITLEKIRKCDYFILFYKQRCAFRYHTATYICDSDVLWVPCTLGKCCKTGDNQHPPAGSGQRHKWDKERGWIHSDHISYRRQFYQLF
jgi:hypothetical protein